MEDSNVVAKWMWMTECCKKMLWNPCDSYFWKIAEEEYDKFISRSS